jgi:5-methylcytosine-specific restriction endonuclease McrBC regulatory subunit McrC
MMNGTEVFGHLPCRTNENKNFLSAASRRRDIRKENIENKRQVCLYWLAMCDVSVIYKA